MRSVSLGFIALALLTLACTSDDGGSSKRSSSSGSGGADITPPTCVKTCSAPADCAAADAGPLQGAANYTCVDGKCEYTGCTSTEECKSALGGTNTTCDVVEGTEAKACYTTCTTVADCVRSNAPAILDEDNYACEGGRCSWTGCNSAEECAATYRNNKYACAAAAGTSRKNCYLTCTSPTDCVAAKAAPVDDLDNYTCSNGLCQWIG